MITQPYFQGYNMAGSGQNIAWAFTQLPDVITRVSQAVAMGKRPIVSLAMGTNGGPITQQQVTDYGTAVRAAGGKFIMSTLLPKDPGSVPTWEAGRQAFKTMLLANPSLYDGLFNYDLDTDFAAGWSATYFGDFQHPNAAGQAKMNAIITPVLLAVSTM